jgi:hypothetical protein
MALCSVYVSYGLDPDRFWRITPREMVAHLEGARERLKAEQDGRAWLAWTTAALSRAQKLPDLESIMSPRKAEPQTTEDLAISIDQMFLAFGGDPAELQKSRSERA